MLLPEVELVLLLLELGLNLAELSIVLPKGVLKRGGVKEGSSGDLRKTSSLPVEMFARGLKEF